MVLSTATVIAQIRDLVATLTGMERVYAASETDENAIPNAINEPPCALILPGPTRLYILSFGAHRHTYEVRVLVMESGADVGARSATVLPFVDRIIEKFVANVTLGNRANHCVFARSSGFVTLEYAGVDYLGYEITLEVSEQGSATPETGS